MYTLDCIVKWAINCNVKCIYFFTYLWNFLCFLKWSLRCTFKCNIDCLSSLRFIELFCELLCTWKCTTMFIFKWNPIGTADAPLILSLLKCRCVFRRTIRTTSTALSFSYLTQVKRQVHSLFHFIVHLQLLSKRTLRRPFKSNIKSIVKCTF